jgi:glutathione S-transferase
MQQMSVPILYTFRRCPYAIRARLAIAVSGAEVEQREVALRNKPQAMLALSPKGTVPVLQLVDGSVIDESFDIMRWALAQNDPENWLGENASALNAALNLIQENDGPFKYYLDRYKYADRYPEHAADYYRDQAATFLQRLDDALGANKYLLGDRPSLADMAIFPFIRQFSAVDKDWFYSSRYTHLIKWLDELLASTLFEGVMKKNDCWRAP